MFSQTRGVKKVIKKVWMSLSKLGFLTLLRQETKYMQKGKVKKMMGTIFLTGIIRKAQLLKTRVSVKIQRYRVVKNGLRITGLRM